MPRQNLRLLILALSVIWLISACGPSEAERQAAYIAQQEQLATPMFALYNEAKQQENWQLAQTRANVIVRQAPESQAAKTVLRETDDIASRAQKQKELNRLNELWHYLSQNVEGQTTPQRTADIYNSPFQGKERQDKKTQARLILRKHPQWGESAYLVIESGTWSCGRPCVLNIQFDDHKAQKYRGTVSSTGTEPAIFIDDDQRFIQQLVQSAQIQIRGESDATPPLLFEVAGFEQKRYQLGR